MSGREWHVYSSDESRESSHELRVMEMEGSDDVMLMIIDGPNPYVCVNEQALLSVLLDLTGEELYGKGVAAPTPLDEGSEAAKLERVQALAEQWHNDGDPFGFLVELRAALADFQLPTRHAAVIEGRTIGSGTKTLLTLIGGKWFTSRGVGFAPAEVFASFTGLRLLREGMDLPDDGS